MIKKYLGKAALRILDTSWLRSRAFGEGNIYLPLSSRLEISESEPWMRHTLNALLSYFDGGLLDVGVNLGQTLVEYKLLRPRGDYLGIEPNPECVAYAKQLARANGFERVTIIPAALADRAGIINLDFYMESEFDSSASIVPNFREDRAVRKSI